MRRLFKSLMVGGVLLCSAAALVLAASGSKHVPKAPPGPGFQPPQEQDGPEAQALWHLTVSYCYVDHCTDHDRVPNYWKPGMSSTSGEDCLAKIETITEGQSREMARHRVLACALKSVDPGSDYSSTNKFDLHHDY